MKKYYKMEKWNLSVSVMEERFLDIQAEKKAPGIMKKLKYNEDIESCPTDMETFIFNVCQPGTPWRTMLRDGLSEDLQYCVVTTKQENGNVINYVECGWRVRLPMEEYLMRKKKLSLKDKSQTLKKKDKERKHLDEED